MEQLTLDDYGINTGTNAADQDDSWVDNEFLLQDRIQKIQQIINQYGEENFYISFSGGKDSVVLSELVDMALPENTIPRVYANTGIELNMIIDFVNKKAETDKRIIIIKPKKSIKQILESEGYPFKSKDYSERHYAYETTGLNTHWIRRYIGIEKNENDIKYGQRYLCPPQLLYQFTPEFLEHQKEIGFKISDKCCTRLKEEPLKDWAKQNKKIHAMIGLMRSEGGRRNHAKCLVFRNEKLQSFHPLAPMTKKWEEWYIKKFNIDICDIYKEPYNFERTGCKGCPFAPNLQEQLDILEKFFPNEWKQCEIIWAPVYAEYRRLGYRLKPLEVKQIEGQMSLFDDEPMA